MRLRLAAIVVAALAVACSSPSKKNKEPEIGWYEKVMLLMGQGRKDEALAIVEEEIKKAPEDPWIRANRGTVLMNMGRLDDAVKEFEFALMKHPESTYLLTNIAMAFWKKGQLRDAIDFTDRALKGDRNFAPAMAVKGAALRDMGRPEGVQWLREAYKLQPELEKEFEFPSFRIQPR